MVVCHRCGKENQAHYKFCLGCGAELTANQDLGSLKTVAPNGGGGSGNPLPGIPAAAKMPEPVAVPRPATEAGPGSVGPRECPTCGATSLTKFCGECGGKMPDAEVREAQAAVKEPEEQVDASAAAILTLIRPDGSEGETVNLEEGTNVLGRNHSEVFASDGYLSPAHCELTIGPEGAFVNDTGSLNGVFVKMTEGQPINSGQIFRIGQELLRFDELMTPGVTEDGTEVMGSPNPGFWGRITVVIGNDVDGSSFPLLSDSISLGRERGDINFPDDGYVSGLHAQVARKDGSYILSDLGSSNGTFIRISKKTELFPGTFVLLGQQLFRFDR